MAKPLPKTDAERQAAYRTRKGHSLTILLPADTKQALLDYIERQAQAGHPITISDVINNVLRNQLMRKR